MNYGMTQQNDTERQTELNERYSAGWQKIFGETYKAQAETVELPEADVFANIDESCQDVDTTPSATTMQYKGMTKDELDRDYRKDMLDDQNEQKYKLSTIGKIVIAIYSAIMLGIFVIVVLNTQNLKSMAYAIDTKQDIVYQLQEEVEELENNLDLTKSDEVIMNKAFDYGMVYAD